MMRAPDPAYLLRGPSHSANRLTQLASNSNFWDGVLNPNLRSIAETPTGSDAAGLLFPLPPPHVGIPGTVGEQAIQIGKVGVVIDEEAQAFAIFFAWPPASPHLSSRIITVEVRTAKRCPTAMRTAFNVAAVAMAFADGRTAIRAGFELFTHETELTLCSCRSEVRRTLSGSLHTLELEHVRCRANSRRLTPSRRLRPLDNRAARRPWSDR